MGFYITKLTKLFYTANRNLLWIIESDKLIGMFFLFYVFFEELACEKVAGPGQSFDVLLRMDSRGAFEPSSHWLEDSFLFVLNAVFDSVDRKDELSQIVGLLWEVYRVASDVRVEDFEVGKFGEEFCEFLRVDEKDVLDARHDLGLDFSS